LADRPERPLDVADVRRVQHPALGLVRSRRRRRGRVRRHLLDLLRVRSALAAAAVWKVLSPKSAFGTRADAHHGNRGPATSRQLAVSIYALIVHRVKTVQNVVF
jgi:hypothetical protein